MRAPHEVLEAPLLDAPRAKHAVEVAATDPARAALIRVQLSLAAAEYGRPRAPATTIVGLRHEADALLEQHGARWAGSAGFLASPRFVRGFVEHLELPASVFLDAGPALKREHPILSVRLGAVREVTLERLFDSPALSGLLAVDLSGARLGDDGAIALSRSPHLGSVVWMSLYDNHIGLRGASALARTERLPALQYLAFGKNRIDITPQPRATSSDGSPSVYVISDEARALMDRYGARDWMTHRAIDRHAYPPELYDLLVASGAYAPGR